MKNITEKGRNDLALLFKGVGAEIGVERAKFSEVICKANPETKLYLIDSWRYYKGYRDHVSQDKLDCFLEEVKQTMLPYNCEIIKAFSMDAVKTFQDSSLDFVFIDANHDYKHVKEDIQEWSKKVKKGGIVSGHDYIRRKGQSLLYGVVEAVDQWAEENNLDVTIWKGDKSPSWSYVKV